MLIPKPQLTSSHHTLSCTCRTFLSLKSCVCVCTSVLVTGAGELQQRENGFAVSSQDHGEPHRSGPEPGDHVRGYIRNFSAADAYSPPPQEQ